MIDFDSYESHPPEIVLSEISEKYKQGEFYPRREDVSKDIEYLIGKIRDLNLKFNDLSDQVRAFLVVYRGV